jgi:hypothetical protein
MFVDAMQIPGLVVKSQPQDVISGLGQQRVGEVQFNGFRYPALARLVNHFRRDEAAPSARGTDDTQKEEVMGIPKLV